MSGSTSGCPELTGRGPCVHNSHMEKESTIGLREAKARLSEVVARVRRGGTVLLTHRGRAVARIVPVREEERSLDARLRALEEIGLLAPAPVDAGSRLPAPLEIPEGLARRYLDEDRGLV